MYDLIVIGGGPGGYEAAAHAARMGKRVALVEKERVGGTCLNVGCIPAKTFLRSSRLYSECRQAAAYGIELPSVRFNLPAVVERKNRIVATLTKGVEGLLKRSGVDLIAGKGRLVARDGVRVGDQTYQSGNVLLATGARPAVPPIPGLPAALDSSAMFDLLAPPERLAVIGGGYIGLEFASFFAAVGTRVTVFEMLPRIAAGMDTDVSARLEQALKKSGVEFRISCAVTGIYGNTVHFDGGSLAADCILNATGRVPATEGLGLEDAGVEFDRRGVRASDQGKTNIPGIWACGDVTGRRLLAHAAVREGIVAVNNMFGIKDRMRYDAVPSVIYTHPEVASVGKTEDELKAERIEYRKAVVPMALAGRFLIENEGASGIVKVLTGARHGEVLGVHAVGDLSSEFIVTAGAMIETELCASDVAGLIFPHPTVSEALKAAVLAAEEHA